MSLKVAVYSDEGVDPISKEACIEYFGKRHSRVVVDQLNAKDIEQGRLSSYKVFMVPGGRDQPYARQLAGRANRLIQDFVSSGGFYIGICAGAYYAGKRIAFAVGTANEIVEDRELGFYPDTIQGPYLREYSYDSQSGSCISRVDVSGTSCDLYYNGGPSFKNADSLEGIGVLGRYEVAGKTDPAIVLCEVQRGRALLSAVHFEVGSKALDREREIQNRSIYHVIKTCLGLE